MKLVVGVTGASGAIYGVRLMQVLHDAYPEVETHLVLSKAGVRVLTYETDADVARLSSWASVVHPEGDIGARPASGSAGFDAMAIAPCSLKTLGQIATGTGENLICRAADVMLKEQKKLVLVPREMPLSAIHLENMHKLALMGVFILPASPGFYFRPRTMADLVDHVVGKTLTSLGLEQNLFERWRGQHPERKTLSAGHGAGAGSPAAAPANQQRTRKTLSARHDAGAGSPAAAPANQQRTRKTLSARHDAGAVE